MQSYKIKQPMAGDKLVLDTVVFIKQFMANLSEFFPDENQYPDNVVIQQDQGIEQYYALLGSLLSYRNTYTDIAAFEKWQYVQLYRILNTILHSNRTHADHLIAFTQYRDALERTKVLNSYLQEIANTKSDLIYSGHSNSITSDGILEFIDQITSVVLYVGVGAKMSAILGIYIENGRYPKNGIMIENKHKALFPLYKIDFPIQINANSVLGLPNYNLLPEIDPLKPRAKIIEANTGKTLEVINDKVTLNKIVTKYAGHKIHLATCASFFKYDDAKHKYKQIGPYAKLHFKLFNPQDEKLVVRSVLFNARVDGLRLIQNDSAEDEQPKLKKLRSS